MLLKRAIFVHFHEVIVIFVALYCFIIGHFMIIVDLERRGRYFALGLFYRIRQLWGPDGAYIKVIEHSPLLSATKM